MEPFRTLATALRDSGFDSQARRVEAALDATYTTSTEMLSELGAAVLSARRECRPLSPEQKRLVRDCLKLVQRAWPGFGGVRGLWYRWFG